jgi:serine/threonine protein phosphatase PrpC
LTADSRFIVIASDGLWEFIDNERVVDIVIPYYNNSNPEGACDALVKEATKFWQKVRKTNFRKIVLLMTYLLL